MKQVIHLLHTPIPPLKQGVVDNLAHDVPAENSAVRGRVIMHFLQGGALARPMVRYVKYEVHMHVLQGWVHTCVNAGVMDSAKGGQTAR